MSCEDRDAARADCLAELAWENGEVDEDGEPIDDVEIDGEESHDESHD